MRPQFPPRIVLRLGWDVDRIRRRLLEVLLQVLDVRFRRARRALGGRSGRVTRLVRRVLHVRLRVLRTFLRVVRCPFAEHLGVTLGRLRGLVDRCAGLPADLLRRALFAVRFTVSRFTVSRFTVSGCCARLTTGTATSASPKAISFIRFINPFLNVDLIPLQYPTVQDLDTMPPVAEPATITTRTR